MAEIQELNSIVNPQLAWLVLIVAGLFEVAWAIGIKYTEGFSRPLGIWLFDEPTGWLRMASVALIIAGIVGLKLASSH